MSGSQHRKPEGKVSLLERSQDRSNLARAYAALLKSYGRQASHYDRYWRHYNEATLAATLAAIPPWRGGKPARLLDVGCGTGLLEEALRKLYPGAQMVGVDISWAMLRQARRKGRVPGAETWMNAAAEELPFASRSFDGLVCASSFHYFREPGQVLEEFRRVLIPSGWLVLTDWCDDYLACKICDRFLRVVDRTHFRMYGWKQCEEMLTPAGFGIEVTRKFKISWLWGLMLFRARALDSPKSNAAMAA